MMDSLHVFPDTNVFLHYPPLSQIDWPTLCGASHVQLVVCLQVIHELDEKKGDSRLGDRAARAIKEIRVSSDSGQPLRENVVLSIFNQELRQDDFPTTLSPDSGDDRIVHLVRTYQNQNPDHKVAVATEDLGMELRCSAGGVSIVRMDAAIRLPNPSDELTKKYKQAIEEVSQLKNRLPRLVLCISPAGTVANRNDPCVFELCNSWHPSDIEGELAKIREQHPMQAALDTHGIKVGAMAGMFVTQAQWDKYNTALETYYEEYRKYIEGRDVVASARERSIAFDLWLYNDGKGPATDIDVAISFPDFIPWCAECGTKDAAILEEDFDPPEPPKTPEPPLFAATQMAAIREMVPVWDPPEAGTFRNPIACLDKWTPQVSVKHDEGSAVEIHAQLGKLKHDTHVSVGTFLAVLSSLEDAKPFELAFSVSASELPGKVTGTVPVKIIVQSCSRKQEG